MHSKGKGKVDWCNLGVVGGGETVDEGMGNIAFVLTVNIVDSRVSVVGAGMPQPAFKCSDQWKKNCKHLSRAFPSTASIPWQFLPFEC